MERSLLIARGLGVLSYAQAQSGSYPPPSLYPPEALYRHLTGQVVLKYTVKAGQITNVEAISGPELLTSAAVDWVLHHWHFAENTNGTFTVPIDFAVTK